jgi:tryptophan-rich sensory protein
VSDAAAGHLPHGQRSAHDRQRNALAARLAVNLAVNAAWNWMFFGMRSPRAGLAGTVLPDVSNAELIRCAARTDPWAAAAPAPYGLWCVFAAALDADLGRRNGPGSAGAG